MRSASPAQAGFIASLLKSKALPDVATADTSAVRLVEDAQMIVEPTTRSLISIGRASSIITYLKGLPSVQAAASQANAVELPIGVYLSPDTGEIFKIKENQAKTRKYAVAWTGWSGRRLTLTSDNSRGKWNYAPGVIATIQPGWKMTLEQAKAFILLFGVCVRCGRKLVAADSVERGIGPVCVNYFTEGFAPAAPRIEAGDRAIIEAGESIDFAAALVDDVAGGVEARRMAAVVEDAGNAAEAAMVAAEMREMALVGGPGCQNGAACRIGNCREHGWL